MICNNSRDGLKEEFKPQYANNCFNAKIVKITQRVIEPLTIKLLLIKYAT